MSESNDNTMRILDKITEVSVKVGQIESNQMGMKEDIREIREEDSKQNALLAEHIAGVKNNTFLIHLREDHYEQALKELKESNEASLKELKEQKDTEMSEVKKDVKRALFIPNLAQNVKKSIVWTSGVIGGLAVIGGLILKMMGKM